MGYFTEERVCSEERRFAEFPFSKTWISMRSHLSLFDGMTYVSLTSGCQSDAVTYMIFEYLDHEFCLHSRDAMILFSVADENCPQEVLAKVVQHFEAFLSAKNKG